ncbi:Ppx/GppA family phosphatase [Hyphobacterium sp. HN65]|uniref:Ppx/GppA family phosphatase n=1 Tax=Hyphobacterium lacteum TaxID=3116575 RepID=A0ABU7LLI7_9PROT|nr:Ppx/GppA family phosphatase [Hyphobacterium sp. HN65]MEE2524793.1 Ppx/GppA family phosphatase [Hyphobacterium sp. HN65]
MTKASKKLSAENAIERDIAVIDVGSNSIRLVHFRLEGRALWPVFNEKTSAELGKGVGETGKLNPEGVESALRTLRRFTILLDAKGVSERIVFATAAVRDAEDGPVFVRRAKEEAGVKIKVLTGKQEALMSALGVVAGIPNATGAAADLGGSSLEIIPVSLAAPGKGITLRLGPLAAPDGLMSSRKAAKAWIDERLKEAGPVFKECGDTLYAVGGAWRALAQLAIAEADYPLQVIHQFQLSRGAAKQIADFAARLSPASLAGTPGVSLRRAEMLPYAGLLLKRLMKKGKFNRVVFSAFGLREGAVFDRLPEIIQAVDPLLAGAEAVARPAAPSPSFGRAIAAWLEPVFASRDHFFGNRSPLIRAAAARLCDVGARHHPDHRAALGRELALFAPFAGVAHAERAYMGLALHHRYDGKRTPADSRVFHHLLDEETRQMAMSYGLGLRFAAALSGRSEALLSRFSLSVEDGKLVLSAPEADTDLVVERARGRFEQMAVSLDLEPVLVSV